MSIPINLPACTWTTWNVCTIRQCCYRKCLLLNFSNTEWRQPTNSVKTWTAFLCVRTPELSPLLLSQYKVWSQAPLPQKPRVVSNAHRGRREGGRPYRHVLAHPYIRPQYIYIGKLMQPSNFPQFTQPKCSITVFSGTHHLSLSWTTLIQSTPFNPR